MHSRSIILRSAVALSVAAVAIVWAPPAARAAPNVEYSPPVDAPVSDPFRPPPTPYGPGNRGIEYATAPGESVVAAADGTVTFAGVVAGRRWITLRHADGVRTTYGPMADVEVAAGATATVRGGDRLGSTVGGLLFTARVGDTYIDPASLFGHGPPRVRLVPEPLDLPQVPHGGGGVDLPGADALADALDWERRHVEATPGFLVSLTPIPVVADAVGALDDWRRRREHCTSVASPAPVLQARHVAVLVGGLGSSSDNAAITSVDMTALGYDARDVVRFSYSDGATYTASDTAGDIRTSAQRLAAMLLAVIERADTTVDVIAHSMGGVVARVALSELEASHPGALRRLGTVVTLATPHLGADLASIVTAVDAQPIGAFTLDTIGAAAGLPISADDEAVQQLEPESDFMLDLAMHPIPAGVRVVSIAARDDVVVPVPRAHLDGATNVVVPLAGPTAHDELPGSSAAAREIALAVGGADPTCESAVDALIDATSGGVISRAEHAVAVTQGG